MVALPPSRPRFRHSLSLPWHGAGLLHSKPLGLLDELPFSRLSCTEAGLQSAGVWNDVLSQERQENLLLHAQVKDTSRTSLLRGKRKWSPDRNNTTPSLIAAGRASNFVVNFGIVCLYTTRLMIADEHWFLKKSLDYYYPNPFYLCSSVVKKTNFKTLS